MSALLTYIILNEFNLLQFYSNYWVMSRPMVAQDNVFVKTSHENVVRRYRQQDYILS